MTLPSVLHTLSPEYRDVDEMQRYYNDIGDRYGLWLIEKYKELNLVDDKVYDCQYRIALACGEMLKTLHNLENIIEQHIEKEETNEQAIEYVNFLTEKLEKIDEIFEEMPFTE